MHLSFGRILTGFFILSFSTSLCAQTRGIVNDDRAKFQPRAREMNIGKQASAEFERQVKLVDDAAVRDYIDRIGQGIAKNSDAVVPFTFKIVDSDDVNAVSFPGGFIYLNRGAILAVEDESQLAGVLAHEIGHITARHGMRRDPIVGGVEIASPGGAGSATFGKSMNEVDGYLVAVQSAQPSKEVEADARGIKYLDKSGYDPKALVRFLQKMSEAEGEPNLSPNIMRVLRSHPPTADRIRLLKQRILTTLPVRESYIQSAPDELQAVKSRLVELQPPPDATTH